MKRLILSIGLLLATIAIQADPQVIDKRTLEVETALHFGLPLYGQSDLSDSDDRPERLELLREYARIGDPRSELYVDILTRALTVDGNDIHIVAFQGLERVEKPTHVLFQRLNAYDSSERLMSGYLIATYMTLAKRDPKCARHVEMQIRRG